MKDYEKDLSHPHRYTYLYSFKSSDTGLTYILRAEYHREDVFAIKFFAKPHSKSKKKYSLLTNRGHALRILSTCANSVPLLLKEHPEASFGIIGSRTLDEENKEIEIQDENIRFRIYKRVIIDLFGEDTFAHFAYPEISGYLLVNRKKDVISTKNKIEDMFYKNYNHIHNYEDIIDN